jgi:ketopantoate hydroxymethyltransferase
MSVAKKDKRITTKSLIDMKANGEKISMLTAYDYTMAKLWIQPVLMLFLWVTLLQM